MGRSQSEANKSGQEAAVEEEGKFLVSEASRRVKNQVKGDQRYMCNLVWMLSQLRQLRLVSKEDGSFC